jgi:hypothetical protein
MFEIHIRGFIRSHKRPIYLEGLILNSFLNAKRINIFFAYLAIAFGLFSLVFIVRDAVTLTNQYMDAIQSGEITVTGTSVLVSPEMEAEISDAVLNPLSISAILGFLVSLTCFIFQSICNFQWAGCLNRNITETNKTLTQLIKTSKDEDAIYDFNWMKEKLDALRIQLWPFFAYIGTSILGTIFSNAAMFLSIVSFIFLAWYLSLIFKVCTELINIKSQFYSFYLKSNYTEGLEYTILYRNIVMFFFFSIMTLGIYWYYLLFKLTTEINFFLEKDEKFRKMLPNSPVIAGDNYED